MRKFNFVDNIHGTEISKEVTQLAKEGQVLRATRKKFQTIPFVLCFENDALAGFLNFTFDIQKQRLNIYQMAVRNEFRNKGIGAQMLEQVLSKNIDKYNVYVSVFEWNETSCNLFLNRGFKKKSHTIHDGNKLLRLVKNYTISTVKKTSAEQDLFDYETSDQEDLSRGFYYNSVETMPMTNVIDRRKGDWKVGRRFFKDISDYGNQGRPDGITYGNLPTYIKGNMQGTSIHDPYLTFNVYQFFSRKGDKILDPFAGGIPRGVIAERMDREYTGIDVRHEQIESNIEISEDLGVKPFYILGDSEQVLDTLDDLSFDLVYTSPPFWGCEIYSQEEKDLSNMDLVDFQIKYETILKKTSKKLKPLGNFVIEVGDGRDSRGYFTLQPEMTAQILQESGLKLYNRFTIIDPLGTKAYTSKRANENGKFTGTHKLMYHFIK